MPNSKQTYELPQPQFAKVLGVSGRHLYNLRSEGMPHRLEGNTVWYPMPLANEWYWRRKLSKEAEQHPEDAPDPDRVSYAEADRRKLVAEMERKELEVLQLKGRLVDVDLVRSTIANLVQRLRGYILSRAELQPVADEILLELRETTPPELEPEAEESTPAAAAAAKEPA